MHYTMFDTPVLKTLLYWGALIYMKIFRWKLEGTPPDIPKYVMIAAPHTSNWDLVITLILAFAFQLKVYWVGKHTIFKPPFGAPWTADGRETRSPSPLRLSRTMNGSL